MTERRSAERPAPGLLAVRTPDDWFLTPAPGVDPVGVAFGTVVALARASGGEPLDLDDDVLAELRASGSLAPVAAGSDAVAVDPAEAELLRSAVRWSSPHGHPAIAPLPADAWLYPVAALLGRFIAGGLLVEGRESRQLLLDDVDLTLLDVLAGAAGAAVRDLVVAATGALGEAAPSADELRTRLARLESLGRVRYYPEPTPEPAPDAAADASAADAPASPAAPAGASRGTSEGAEALRHVAHWLRHQPFPGRDRLKTTYRRFRPGAAASDATDADPTAAAPATHVATDTEPTVPTTPPPPVAVARPEGQPDADLYREHPRVGPERPGTIPVYSPFQRTIGPLLSLGMLTAYARHVDDGILNEAYEIRRTEDPDSFLADVAARPGPGIVLCSNYIWSMQHNLALVERAHAINPELVFVHGGPHTPKYDADCAAFFAEHPDTVHVTVRSEGEVTLSEILRALQPGLPSLDLTPLHHVAGISFRDPATGSVVKTPDRDRIADLDALPSPYLTGEFDHLTAAAFSTYLTFETNRGCPYGCTFCDWGSMTLSRIRLFSLDRVRAEMTWAGDRGFDAWVLADANAGIMSRDVEVIDCLVDIKRTRHVPSSLGFNLAKNTTKHLTAIVDRLVDNGVAPHVSLSLQTRDDGTLEAIRRTNISTDHYVALAASFRRRGLPLQADLMLGLPGQTVESFRGDLQFLMDHEIPARVWITQLLPNAPMNDPAYRDEFGVVAGADGVVLGSSSFTPADRERMKKLRHAHAVFERFGLARHLMRYLQWDHGIAITDFMQQTIRLSDTDPDRYPLLNWTLRYFDHFGVPPLGWRSFYDELRRFVIAELGVEPSVPLDTVIELQRFLMPEFGRQFPDSLVLDHDYVSYHHAATARLWGPGDYQPPERRLAEFGPATFTIAGDPMERCKSGMAVYADPRNETVTDTFWMSAHLELDSPLIQNYADIAGTGDFSGISDRTHDQMAVLAELGVEWEDALAAAAAERAASDDPHGDVLVRLTAKSTAARQSR